jgi:predicted nucleic acid-binding protein
MKKIKIYLDTNTIIDFFINQAIAIKKGKETKVPSKLKFFLEIRDKVEFLTSFFTETEVARELIAGYGLQEEEFNNLWKNFLEGLKCKYIEEFKLDKELANYPKKIKMKLRTMVNFIHLFVAMKENSYLVSGDNNLIKIVRENRIYDKILTYPELRRLISSSPDL